MQIFLEWLCTQGEQLCTKTDHQFGRLCEWVVRRDEWWREGHPASQKHRELRALFESGVADLPFPPPVETAAPDHFDSPAPRFTRRP